MGQHKYNPTAILAKAGVLPPKQSNGKIRLFEIGRNSVMDLLGSKISSMFIYDPYDFTRVKIK